LDPPDPSDEEQLVRVGKGERSKRFTHSVDGPSSVTVGEGVVGRVNKEIADCSEQHTWMMSIRRRPRDEVEQIGIVSDPRPPSIGSATLGLSNSPTEPNLRAELIRVHWRRRLDVISVGEWECHVWLLISGGV
jgi:hypothetical protein